MRSVTLTRHPVSTLTPAPAVPALERSAKNEAVCHHFAAHSVPPVGVGANQPIRLLHILADRLLLLLRIHSTKAA